MRQKIILFLIATLLLSTKPLTAKEEMPTREERIYSLSTIWKEMCYNFAFPETLQKANIDSLYLAYLPKIEQAEDNYDYYRTLCAFMTHFNEAHTRIYTNNRPDDMPPLKTINFGEKIIVSNIAQSMAGEIPIGSEIIKINQIPVADYIKDAVYPYIAAATSHWKFDKSVSEMLYGKPLSEVNLTIMTPKGREKDVKMIRNYHSNETKEVMANSTYSSPINIKIIDKNIGYIQLSSFAGQYIDTINSIFNSNLPQLRKCKGLIIDIRGNRGGIPENIYPLIKNWENISLILKIIIQEQLWRK